MRSSLAVMLGFTALLALVVTAPAAAQLSPIRSEPMRPSEYAPSDDEPCRAQRRRGDEVTPPSGVCDGPRRVPLPRGEAAERAARLNLGVRSAADRLWIGAAPDAWIAELASPPADDMLWPVPRGLFSRGFGYVRRQAIHDRPHNGVDIVAEEGAHIRAVNDALVVYADNRVIGYGNLLILLHADGTGTFYGHCRAIYVAPGQLVARGQVVAEVGSTGRPVVPHLHMEWRRRGHPLDPMPRFVERPDHRDIRPDSDGRDFAPPPPNHRPPTASDGAPAGGDERARALPSARRGSSQEEEEEDDADRRAR